MPTLLLDLDDTLLINNVQTFLPAYLQAWADFVIPHLDPQRMVRAMIAGTRAMSKNLQPDCSLREVFDGVFYPAIGIEKEAFQPLEEQFYREIFPSLQPLTQSVQGARALVEALFERGYQIAIATNPYFPLTAIQQRLSWAGLPVDQLPFLLVPNIDTFHFGKPHTAYYAEMLALIGWPNGTVVMVGDEPELDISPANRFGLATYWIVKAGAHKPVNLQYPHGQGELKDLLPWLDQLTEQAFEADLATQEALLATLRSTPAALNSLSLRMLADEWTCHPESGEWCAAEIACHLRDVDLEVNLPRLNKITMEENPFLAGMDTDRWNQERQYHFQDGPQALKSFVSARLRLLAMLDVVGPQDWQRTATHSIFGRTDLGELISIIAGHDRLHIQQFLAVLAAARLQSNYQVL